MLMSAIEARGATKHSIAPTIASIEELAEIALNKAIDNGKYATSINVDDIETNTYFSRNDLCREVEEYLKALGYSTSRGSGDKVVYFSW